MIHRSLVVALLILFAISAGACAQPQPGPPAPPEKEIEKPAAAGLGELVPAPPSEEKTEKPAGITLDGLLANMEAARKKLAESRYKTFRAKAAKTHYVVYIDDTERYAGTIEFRMPRLLRVTLTREGTDEEEIAIVGEKYGWRHYPARKYAERVTLPPVEEQKTSANPLEYGLAQSIYGLREAYLLQMQAPEKAGEVEAIPLVLTPREGESYDAGKIIFWIDPKTWLPVQVRQYLSNNEIVDTYTFTDVETNVRIRDSVFDFDPPRGVQVIDQDEK